MHDVKTRLRPMLALIVVLLWAPATLFADVSETRRLAESGDAWYQTELALLYHQGKKLPRDYNEALRWYSLAAAQGFSKAEANLGVMYARGEGVAQDYKLAADWFLKAAGKGNTLAQHNLGLLYGRGQGVPQDYAEAYVWESLAASAGHADAARNRDLLKARLDDNELAAARRRESFLYLKIENRKSMQ